MNNNRNNRRKSEYLREWRKRNRELTLALEDNHFFKPEENLDDE